MLGRRPRIERDLIACPNAIPSLPRARPSIKRNCRSAGLSHYADSANGRIFLPRSCSVEEGASPKAARYAAASRPRSRNPYRLAIAETVADSRSARRNAPCGAPRGTPSARGGRRRINRVSKQHVNRSRRIFAVPVQREGRRRWLGSLRSL